MATKKLKERRHRLSLDVFFYDITVVFTNSVAESVEKMGFREPRTGYACCIEVVGSGRSYMFLPWSVSPSVVAHECVHALNSVLRYIGAEHEEEIYAYHLQHLIDKIGAFRYRPAKKKKGAQKESNSNG